MDPILKISQDGSHTLFRADLDETYHSIHGAIQESKHVFIHAGFDRIEPKETISIFEMGFGTGLNALLTLQKATVNKQKIYYNTIEAFPLEEKIINELNYSDLLEQGNSDYFQKIHHCPWEAACEINDFFTIEKNHIEIENYILNKSFDLIYYDAFSPDKQESLWSVAIFEKLYKSLNTNGILVTYSAKGIVKRALRAAGFEVKRLQGPPGKHHMLLAIKKLRDKLI